MSVQSKTIEFINHITGSAGGWPSLSNAAIIGGMDYIVESGSNEVKFVELNTNVGIVGSAAMQTGSYFDVMADYAVSQSYDKCFVYGMAGKKQNPTYAQQALISSSFARHNIPVTFEYQMNTSHTYFSQRGQAQYSGSFHLFYQTPWWDDSTLLNMVSGSFSKSTFRTILGSSPVSSSLIPLFNTGSFSSNNPHHPDYLVREPGQHAAGPMGQSGMEFHKYNPSTNAYQNAVSSGSLLIEKFIVGSGSVQHSEGYATQLKLEHLMTSQKQVLIQDRDMYGGNNIAAPKYELKGDRWYGKNTIMLSTASGSLIKMYDGSTKQVQDVEVGDIVKSYLPVGMPDEFSAQDWYDYSTNTLEGSTMSGSVVVRTFSSDAFGYRLINGSIKVPYTEQGMHSSVVQYFVKDSSNNWSWRKPADGLYIGESFLNSSEEEVEITSITEVSESLKFYSLDVEDIDTYFQSDIVVHNLPPK